MEGKKGYPDRQTAKDLLKEAAEINPGAWERHCENAAACAEKIAAACGLDSEKAYVLGLLHDIGRKFLVRDLGHIYYGYKYMLSLGYDQAARVCLTHSFPNQSLAIYIGKTDIPKEEADEVKDALSGEVVASGKFTCEPNRNNHVTSIGISHGHKKIYLLKVTEEDGTEHRNHYLFGYPAFDIDFYRNYLAILSEYYGEDLVNIAK